MNEEVINVQEGYLTLTKQLGNDFVKRWVISVFSRWRNIDNDSADVTSAGRCCVDCNSSTSHVSVDIRLYRYFVLRSASRRHREDTDKSQFHRTSLKVMYNAMFILEKFATRTANKPFDIRMY